MNIIAMTADELKRDGVTTLSPGFWDLPGPYNRSPNGIVNPADKDLKAIREYVESFNLKILAVDYYPSFIAPVPNLTSEVERVKSWIDVVHKLGGSILKGFVGEPPSDMPLDKQRQLAVNGLKKVVPHAEKQGIRFSIECHPWYPTPLESNPILLAGLIEEVGSEYLGATLDFSLFPYAAMKDPWGKDWPTRNLEDLKPLLPHINFVHAKCFDFDDKGDETKLNYKGIISALKEGGYDGDVAVEYEGWWLKKIGEKLDPISEIRKCLTLIKKYWK